MGRMLVREILTAKGCELVGAVSRRDSPEQGMDVGMLAGTAPVGVRVGDDPVPLFADADAVIDFTVPEATARYAALAAQGKTVHVVGTTGLGADQESELEKAARHTPVVYAPNMSLAVNLLFALVEQVAAKLDDDFDIEIVEMHHRQKVDAPSGTALGLGRAAAAGRGVPLAERAVRGRDGKTGPRGKGDIGFAALRGGDVVGDHSVVCAGPGERLELTHRAAGREIYARGAVHAARWAYGKPPGLYTMQDVLGL
ncbi:MAG: 4-hydroxy-tetrahydrodipicolinate reductase [Inquilinus sp.]|nr:4-hydroxy-tetrahydrodipicolinate reductase [Inquilinus sp.]